MHIIPPLPHVEAVGCVLFFVKSSHSDRYSWKLWPTSRPRAGGECVETMSLESFRYSVRIRSRWAAAYGRVIIRLHCETETDAQQASSISNVSCRTSLHGFLCFMFGLFFAGVYLASPTDLLGQTSSLIPHNNKNHTHTHLLCLSLGFKTI